MIPFPASLSDTTDSLYFHSRCSSSAAEGEFERQIADPVAKAPDYHISWGWDYANDFTVMTVLHWPSQQEAFFGYAHPNAAGPVTTYKDAGPNAVQNV